MSTALYSLNYVHLELTNRCNKSCWMCGRRKVEKTDPKLDIYNNDMDFSLVEEIATQLPPNITIAFHNNGEPLLYPRFGEAVSLFPEQITNIVTNGKLLIEKSNEIIDNLDTLAISIIENDLESYEQFYTIEEFLALKGNRPPYTILRMNGDVNPEPYEKFGLKMAKRLIHSPMGSFNYKKKNPTIPEGGVCWDFLSHLAINTYGDVSICVRFDPNKKGVIGNIKEESLEQIWNGKKRNEWLNLHKLGKRHKIPLCSECEFWGVPTGGN